MEYARMGVEKYFWYTRQCMAYFDALFDGFMRKVALGAFVLLALFALWSFSQYRRVSERIAELSTTEGQRVVAQQEVEELVAVVGKLIALPQDEAPVVATIVDPDALAAQQTFYKGAIQGDKVLVYVKAQKGIIYSPSRGILVNVGPAYVQPQSGTEETTTDAKTQ